MITKAGKEIQDLKFTEYKVVGGSVLISKTPLKGFIPGEERDKILKKNGLRRLNYPKMVTYARQNKDLDLALLWVFAHSSDNHTFLIGFKPA